MSDLVQAIKDGKLVSSTTSSTSSSSSSSNSSLGKDDFLQLLVTQMKYQDPLNPSSDTEYVSQLATFSQLEQMQNLNQTTVNSQAFSLIGQQVIVQTEDSSGNTKYYSGSVDYVTMSSGKAQLSINGSLYSIDDVYQVIGSSYMAELGIPSIDTTSLSYSLSSPKNVSFDVDLGVGDYAADDVAIKINGSVLDSDDVTLSGNTVTINKDALSGLTAGTYDVIVGFNNYYSTTVSGKVTLNVTD